MGVEWKAETLDTFKAGDPSTLVTGIVTTSTPTIGVLERAVKAGANFVICCEPTFYGRADKPAPHGEARRGGQAPPLTRRRPSRCATPSSRRRMR